MRPEDGRHARSPLLDVVDVGSVRHHGRGAPSRAQRPLRRGVVDRYLALRLVHVLERRQLLNLALDVSVESVQVLCIEDDGVAPAARAAPAVVEVEAGQVLQHLVEGLLLVLAGFPDAQHLMRAELPYLVPLEYVVLAHPVQLAGGVISDPFDLRKENSLIMNTSSDN